MHDDGVGEAGCAGEALAAGAGVLSWIFTRMSAIDLVRHGASRMGTVAVVGSILVGGFATGYTVGTWLQCMREQ